MIRLILNDITKLKVDCIVNAANNTLLGGAGVDGAIHKAAGPRLLAECRALRGCDTGQAKITNGYNLPAKYIIHTVGPIYSGKESDSDMLHKCYMNSLNLARKHNIHSLAFSSISTGCYGFPKQEATKIAVSTTKKWLSQNKDYDIEVIFCCYDKETYSFYEKNLL